MLYDIAPTYNYGAKTNMYISDGLNGIAVSLLKFDLSGIPAEITAANLVLYIGGLGTTISTISVYRILAANAEWIEGSKTGSSAGSTEPSWNQRTGLYSWAGSAGMSTSGTDYSATALGVLDSVSFGELPKYVTIPLTTAEIEKMRDGTYTNGGIVLRSAHSSEENIILAMSKEYATSAYRPVLQVTYTAAAVADKFGPYGQWM